MKRVTYLDSPETREEVRKAIRDLSMLVGTTLGPGGRVILLEQENRPPLSTKDGVTVARHFYGNTPISRVVSDAAREVCERTVRQVGDGTTTAIVLASALVESGHKWLSKHRDYSPQRLCRELKEIFNKEIKPEIMKLSRPIKGMEHEEAKKAVRHVALVSSNHDVEIADAVAEAIDYVGDDGMIIAEEGIGAETKVVHRDGFPVTAGLSDLGGTAAAAFVNRKNYADCVLEASYVAMYDGEINDIETILPLLERIAGELDSDGRPIRSPVIIVAHRFSDQVLKILAQNFRQGILSSVPFVTPRSGQASGKQQFLFDLASYVGGQVFDPQGNPIQGAFPNMLGCAESVKVGQNEAVFLTEPEQTLVEARIADLKKQMDDSSEFDKDLIRYRIGQLTGGIATVFAGGSTALEAKERHARVIDAVSAVRSAMEVGVVPGGGATLATVANKLFHKNPQNQDLPTMILAQAMLRPFSQILMNAGIIQEQEECETVFNGIGDRDGKFMVYDALEHKYVEWYEGGIMDPTKVALTALENALSVSQTLMTLGGIVASVKTENEESIKAMQDGILRATQGELE